jgi:hypothetical protein
MLVLYPEFTAGNILSEFSGSISLTIAQLAKQAKASNSFKDDIDHIKTMFAK